MARLDPDARRLAPTPLAPNPTAEWIEHQGVVIARAAGRLIRIDAPAALIGAVLEASGSARERAEAAVASGFERGAA
ncbi:MAG: hypothetical protein OEY14_03835, partial [Myxococcales bacterium]|nr:hypothetical protein [Myxococcales bacterium]